MNCLGFDVPAGSLVFNCGSYCAAFGGLLSGEKGESKLQTCALTYFAEQFYFR